MCGILGVRSKSITGEAFRSALESIAHRGPDAQGIECIPKKNIWFGHRRLSILDLSNNGSQPMYSDCGNFLIVFNGEVYNFKTLRNRLPKQYQDARSDTRVLVELIAKEGIYKALPMIDGMFAIAVLDIRINKLYLARDPFGEKPLYLFRHREDFSFCSELKPLIKLFKEKLSLDKESITEFLKYSYVPRGRSIFNEVSQVAPGHVLEYPLDRPESIQSSAYWSPAVNEERSAMTFEESALEFESLFNESVRRRCISDAPLGAFLSGGYDSTAVVASMVENNIRNIKTFTIGFEESSFNEAPFAKRISETLGTDHTELYVPPSAAFEIIPQLAKVYDEPFADVSQLPTLLLSKLTRGHVTVALSGDGGDELFAGYSRYTIGADLWGKLSKLSPSIRKLASAVISDRTLPLVARLNNFLPEYRQVKNLSERAKKLNRILASSTQGEFYEKLTTHDVLPLDILLDGFSKESGRYNQLSGDLIPAMMHKDLTNYLPGDILTKVDRATMYHSLESRTPFLNVALYNFSQKIPFEFLYKERVGKIILKDYVHKRVPEGLVNRPKMGFGVPISSWLKSELRPWMLSVLDEKDIRERGIFDGAAIRKLVSDHEAGKGNKHNSLWNVLVLTQWLQEYDFSA